MALNAKIVTITQPGATGNQTYSLPTGFNAKAIIALSVARTADGGGRTDSTWAYGIGTYRSSTVAQRYIAWFSSDNVATSVTTSGGGIGALLRMPQSAATTTTDLEIALVSLNANDFVLNWVNLHTTASIQVQCLVFGGDSVTDALVNDFSVATTPATQAFTVATGFGQPDLLLFCGRGVGFGDTFATGARVNMGYGAKSGAAAVTRGMSTSDTTAAATQQLNIIVDNDSFPSMTGATLVNDFTLDAPGNWPTDGFQVTAATQTSQSQLMYLALKFSSAVTVTTGNSTIPTAAPTQTQTLTSAGTPKAALLFHSRETTAATINTTGAEIAMFGVGAIDSAGANMFVGASDDDGQSTASVCGTYQSTSKAIQSWSPSTPSIGSEASGAVSGSDFQLSWADTDGAAYIYHWVTLGEAVAATAVRSPVVATQAALVRAACW